jgi:hypothetical protein
VEETFPYRVVTGKFKLRADLHKKSAMHRCGAKNKGQRYEGKDKEKARFR